VVLKPLRTSRHSARHRGRSGRIDLEAAAYYIF
jgi:hypothetical protein